MDMALADNYSREHNPTEVVGLAEHSHPSHMAAEHTAALVSRVAARTEAETKAA